MARSLENRRELSALSYQKRGWRCSEVYHCRIFREYGHVRSRQFHFGNCPKPALWGWTLAIYWQPTALHYSAFARSLMPHDSVRDSMMRTIKRISRKSFQIPIGGLTL